MFTILLRYGLSISITHVMIVLDDRQIVFTFSLILWQWDGTCSWNCYSQETTTHLYQYDVMTWKHFPGYWPFVRGIHRSPVNSPHKGQWRGALMSSLICTRTNGSVNNREAGDLRRHRCHYDVTVMTWRKVPGLQTWYPDSAPWVSNPRGSTWFICPYSPGLHRSNSPFV